jgi:hypothetical protein
MIFTLISHHCIFPPSVRLSVSRLPSSQSPNDPMTLKAFRCDRFRFLPGLLALNSRRFRHDLSTVKALVTLDAPHRSVVIAFIRLVTQNDCRTHNTAGGRVDPGCVFSGIVSRLGSRVIIPSCYRVILGNGHAKPVPGWRIK